MKLQLMFLLGTLVMNLTSVSGDCTKEQEINTWRTIYWFMRYATQTSAKCVNIYIGLESFIDIEDQVSILKDENKLTSYDKVFALTKCYVIIFNKEINYSEILRLKHPPTLVIVRNKQEKIQENRYGLQRYLTLTQCSGQFKYWDLHKQKFTGVWSTHYSRIVLKNRNDNRMPDSFFNQEIRVSFVQNKFFLSENNQIHPFTKYGQLFTTFTDKYQLQTILRDVEALDKKGLNFVYGQVINQVLYKEADIAVGGFTMNSDV
ncbi:uncharacterized protein LOC111697102 [Eurytemora carolleeae]|uniref:uncharacterized protein LOC111697102 n=1 Tax=Eurytemora carolleeae TaxID=1294199 RepID=UPI000C78D7C8|nr:uncharacterized protein LOC111697102 [Eurytemora carolleeae]|eukprot:XP_023322762.1 uncharacterized protein LOC111697102 [Eurytemora affinis]